MQQTDGITLIIRAAAFAAHKHRDQKRKDKEASPYINHPIALAEVLSIEGQVLDPVVIAAALLHDTAAWASFQRGRGSADSCVNNVTTPTKVSYRPVLA